MYRNVKEAKETPIHMDSSISVNRDRSNYDRMSHEEKGQEQIKEQKAKRKRRILELYEVRAVLWSSNRDDKVGLSWNYGIHAIHDAQLRDLGVLRSAVDMVNNDRHIVVRRQHDEATTVAVRKGQQHTKVTMAQKRETRAAK